jgi:hypothetical protein
MEQRTLDSYGVSQQDRFSLQLSSHIIATNRKQALRGAGHDDYLREAPFYYEDDSIVGVHAGLTPHQTWAAQRASLETAAELSSQGFYLGMPEQIASFSLANTANRPGGLADKTLVTGHEHFRNRSADERVIKVGGRATRVFLASALTKGEPLFVYDTDEQKVRSIA